MLHVNIIRRLTRQQLALAGSGGSGGGAEAKRIARYGTYVGLQLFPLAFVIMHEHQQ